MILSKNDIFPSRPSCADDSGSWCATIYRWTSNDALARSADAIVSTALRTALIIIVALAVRWLLHRLINRLVEGATSSRVSRFTHRLPRGAATANTTGPINTRNIKRARTIGSVLRSITSVVVLSVAGVMILGEFGVNLAPIIASAGILGIAVGFGAQNLVRDFLSGMFMLLEDQYGVGDIIDVGAATGTVEAVGLRITTLRDVKGTVWYVRNGEIQRVGNQTQGFAYALTDIPLGYAADLQRATEVAGKAASDRLNHSDVARDVLAPVDVQGVESVGPDGLTLRITVKVKPGKQFAVQRALNGAVTEAFDAVGIPRPSTSSGSTPNTG